MIGIYLFAAVVGGGLLLFSLLGGSEHDVQHPGDVPDHGDLGGHAADTPPSGPGLQLLVGLFRPRNLIFFLGAFGVTGTLLTVLEGPRALTLPLSLAMGAGAMLATHAVFAWLRRTESAIEVTSESALEGRTGRVTLPVGPESRGRVVCLVGGREVHLVARLAEGASETIGQGAEVVLWRVANGEAQVKALPVIGPAPEAR